MLFFFFPGSSIEFEVSTQIFSMRNVAEAPRWTQRMPKTLEDFPLNLSNRKARWALCFTDLSALPGGHHHTVPARVCPPSPRQTKSCASRVGFVAKCAVPPGVRPRPAAHDTPLAPPPLAASFCPVPGHLWWHLRGQLRSLTYYQQTD